MVAFKKWIQPFEQELFLQISVANWQESKTLAFFLLCFWRIQRTQTNFENSAFPNTFIMVMRKYLQEVIEQIQQVENDRIFRNHFVSNKMNWDDISVTWLLKSWASTAIILLTRQLENSLIEAIKHVGFSQNSYRTIFARLDLSSPPKPMRPNLLQSWRSYSPFSTGKSWHPKNLQTHFQGLGRDTAQELASRLETG